MFWQKIKTKNLFFLQFMLRNNKILLSIVLLNIFTMIFNILEPLLAKKIVDTSFSLHTLQELLIPSIYWLSIFCMRYIALYLLRKADLKYSLSVYERIRRFLFADILKKPLHFFQKNTPAYIISRCNTDINNLEGMLLHKLIAGILAVMQIAVIVILMLEINILLTLIVIVLEGLILYIQFALPLKKLYKEHNEALARMDKHVQNVFSCIKLIKSANSNIKEEEHYKNVLDNYMEKRYSRDNFNIIRTVVTGFSLNFIYPAVIIAGGILIYHDFITMGAVMAFIMYFQKINALFNEAFAFIPLYKIAKVSADRLQEIINEPNENIAENDMKLKINQPIVFDNVNFAYDDKNILNNFSLTIYPHKINAVIGVSGSGKSTLVNLLMGFIKADSGSIYINGQDINNYNINTIRNSIALLSQESILLQRSIGENILYHAKSADNIKIQSVLQKSKVEDFISKLPDVFSHMLTDSGSNFSGGERQRLCLARELLKDANVYIFDEATSALDNETEKVILQTIKELAQTKTVLMITHKLENTKIADVINIMDDGRICESGSYAELMKIKGMYYSLICQQKFFE